MTRHLSMSDGERLTRCEVSINNTLNNPEIQTAVTAVSYTPEKMNAGKALYDAAMAALNDQMAAQAAKKKATDTYNAARVAAIKAYQNFSKLAHATFADDPTKLDLLGLNGPMPGRTGEFITAGYALFTNAGLPAIAPLLTAVGYTSARRTADLALIAAMDQANLAQEQAKGAALQATNRKKAAIDAVDRWNKLYLKFAQVALADNPKLLECLGVKLKPRKRRAKKADDNNGGNPPQ